MTGHPKLFLFGRVELHVGYKSSENHHISISILFMARTLRITPIVNF